MIRCEVIEDFTLKNFEELKNIERGTAKEEKGKLFKYDKFECSKDMCEYLTGNNSLNKSVVKVIEVEPKEEDLGFVVVDTKAESEIIKPLDEEKAEKLGQDLEEHIEVKPKKRKTSKK